MIQPAFNQTQAQAGLDFGFSALVNFLFGNPSVAG